MSLHSDTLFWFRANQCLLFLLNAACLAEKEQIPILWSLVLPNRGSNPQFTTLEVSTLTITSPMNPQSTTLEVSTLTITSPMQFGGLRVVSSSPSHKKDQSGLLLLLCIHHRCLLKSMSLIVQAPAPQNLRIYLSLRIFSSKEILKFDWLRTQIWANKNLLSKEKVLWQARSKWKQTL